LLGFEYSVQRRTGELQVVEGQQRFKIDDRIQRDLPLPSLVDVRQGRFNSALGDLELLGWIIAISSTLQKPAQIHGAYELIHEVPISVATPARD
jgi:hypothetical protein